MKQTIIVILLFLGVTAFSMANMTQDSIPENALENQKCMKCHGKAYYSFYNDWIERDVKKRMNPYYVIDSMDFHQSNHKSFRCTDCHSADYETFPHAGELRMEPSYTCMDCHGGDDDWAAYHFEDIEMDYNESVHAKAMGENFSCWACHNPHSYKVMARTEEKIRDVIKQTNQICLDCHSDANKFELLSESENPNILEKHDWLPNQKLHFSSVRCIECHGQQNDSLLISHNIVGAAKAVKNCVECHSDNSLLMASLYRFQAKESRSKAGFFNASLLGEYYVIGANRNYYLNLISIIIFGMVILGISIHVVLRIIKK
jgi:Doubled CXXCH motif (Paired_CXXCH_1)